MRIDLDCLGSTMNFRTSPTTLTYHFHSGIAPFGLIATPVNYTSISRAIVGSSGCLSRRILVSSEMGWTMSVKTGGFLVATVSSLVLHDFGRR